MTEKTSMASCSKRSTSRHHACVNADERLFAKGRVCERADCAVTAQVASACEPGTIEVPIAKYWRVKSPPEPRITKGQSRESQRALFLSTRDFAAF